MRRRGRAATLAGMFRFLHSSDLHLGKPFGGFPDDIRHRLREARHGAIARLATAARAAGARHILLAGDTFDAETPASTTLRQALTAMAGASDLDWVLLPGNHDSLAATELWRRIAADCPPNVMPVLEPAPITLAPGITLLPAPVPVRRPGRDLTDWFDGAGSGGVRIGLAHGPVQGFGEETGAIIAPDRAARAGLDWLALGDWHGEVRVGPRTAYAGAPERDGFKHGGTGTALAVTVEPGAPARAESVATGVFDWRDILLDLVPGTDAAAGLAARLPPVAARREVVARLVARGRTDPAGRAALTAALAAAAPDFGWFSADLAGLALDVSTEDLDRIDRAGALRAAAEALQAESADPALAAAERQVAATALARLFAYAAEGAR